MRGDVVQVPADRLAKGREQRGARYGVVVQSDDLLLSTVLVVPTTTRRSSSPHRPEITVQGEVSTLLTEQTRAISRDCLGQPVGRLSYEELRELGDALRLVLSLD